MTITTATDTLPATTPATGNVRTAHSRTIGPMRGVHTEGRPGETLANVGESGSGKSVPPAILARNIVTDPNSARGRRIRHVKERS